MPIDQREIIETIRMTTAEHLDIRTVTVGISLRDCRRDTPERTGEAIASKVQRVAADLASAARGIASDYGTPIANIRLAVTPIAVIGDGFDQDGFVTIGRALDAAAASVNADYVGGVSAWVQ